MDATLLKNVIAQIHRRFPEFAGAQPTVRQQNAPQPKSAGAPSTYLLTFRSTARAGASGEKSIPRAVRVVVSEKGKILKITTSR
jgi:hypothetical protein